MGAILTLQLQKTTQPNGSVQCEVLAPQLHPTVTHYDAGKSNVRTYLLQRLHAGIGGSAWRAGKLF